LLSLAQQRSLIPELEAQLRPSQRQAVAAMLQGVHGSASAVAATIRSATAEMGAVVYNLAIPAAVDNSFSMRMSVSNPQYDDPLAVMWRTIIARKWVMVSIVAAFTLSAIAVALLSKPIYRVTAVLMPAQSATTSGALSEMLGNLGGLASLSGLNLNDDTEKAEAIAVLRSRIFTEAFIRDENLLPVLFSDLWDESGEGHWIVPPDEVPSLYDAFRLFDRKVRRITEDTRSGLIRLDIEWGEPEVAARWANELVRRVNVLLREKAIAEAEASVRFLDEEFAATNVITVKQSISTAIEYHVKRRALAATMPEYAFKTIDPAAPPDADDFVRPQKALIVIAGFLVGALVALGVVLSWERIAPRGAPHPRSHELQ
jgi:hypothetical protein